MTYPTATQIRFYHRLWDYWEDREPRGNLIEVIATYTKTLIKLRMVK